MSGELGAGKTVFTQGILQGLDEDRTASSPSFVIINRYDIKKFGVPFYHVDLYRLEDTFDIEDLGFSDILDGRSIVAIEWAQKAQALLPAGIIKVDIEPVSENERRITIIAPEERRLEI